MQSEKFPGLLGRESQLEENLPSIPHPAPRFLFFSWENGEENASLEV